MTDEIVGTAPDLIVVGGGIGGCAAVLRAVQYHRRVIWLRGNKNTAKRSRSQWVANIDNMVGIHEGVVRGKLAKLLRGNDDALAALNDAHHVHIGGRDIIKNTVGRIVDNYGDFVEIIDNAAEGAVREADGFVVKAGGERYSAPYLVLATGVMDKQPQIKKQKGDEVIDEPRWIYPFANRETVLYCIRCEGHLTAATRAAVIGSSESAAQLAMMLYERYGSGCAVLTNGDSPAWSERSAKLLEHYGVTVHLARIVDIDGAKGKLRTMSLEDGKTLEMQFALVSLGLHRVYNELARELGAELTNTDQPVEVRHVLVSNQSETTVPNLFAVGDMTRHADGSVMKQVYTAQEYAVRAVDSIDWRIRRDQRNAILEG